MKRIELSFLLIILLFLSGCLEPRANISSPKSYSNLGIQFEYPKNWKITEDEQDDFVRYLFIESPGDAIVILQIYGKEDKLDLENFAHDFSDNAKNELPIGVFSDSTFEVTGDYLEEKFTISLLNESVPHRRKYALRDYNEQICFIVFQVAEEDLDKTNPGFDLIIKTLKYEKS
ncbi:MAG: DUF4720 domain-containing protein [Opitutales bacterium]|nr:DUF4720 domain-containing protein [Opitutales bacterium]